MRALVVSVHPILWLAFILYWKIVAIRAKPTARRDSVGHRSLYFLPTIAAIACLVLPYYIPALRIPLFHRDAVTYGLGLSLLVLGLLLAVWARVFLGRNWSNVVTVKVDHELIQSGPYRWVRHPIYTGLLLALAGSALGQDLWIDLAVVPLALLGFWIKLRREELWMHQEFGAAYDTYCNRTARLIPFVL